MTRSWKVNKPRKVVDAAIGQCFGILELNDDGFGYSRKKHSPEHVEYDLGYRLGPVAIVMLLKLGDTLTRLTIVERFGFYEKMTPEEYRIRPIEDATTGKLHLPADETVKFFSKNRASALTGREKFWDAVTRLLKELESEKELPEIPASSLKKRRETVRRMKYVEGKSYKEIAHEIKESEDIVKSDLKWLRGNGLIPETYPSPHNKG